MGRCLIVANQTLGAESLDRAVQERVARGDREFYVVAPMTPIEHETTEWAGGFGVGEYLTLSELVEVRRMMEREERMREVAVAQERRRVEGRLGLMIDAIWSAGGQADGEVGDGDPVAAVAAVLERESFDEIIVSTLPAPLSRWLRMDLPARIAEMTDALVATIEAPQD